MYKLTLSCLKTLRDFFGLRHDFVNLLSDLTHGPRQMPLFRIFIDELFHGFLQRRLCTLDSFVSDVHIDGIPLTCLLINFYRESSELSKNPLQDQNKGVLLQVVSETFAIGLISKLRVVATTNVNLSN